MAQEAAESDIVTHIKLVRGMLHFFSFLLVYTCYELLLNKNHKIKCSLMSLRSVFSQ